MREIGIHVTFLCTPSNRFVGIDFCFLVVNKIYHNGKLLPAPEREPDRQAERADGEARVFVTCRSIRNPDRIVSRVHFVAETTLEKGGNLNG